MLTTHAQRRYGSRDWLWTFFITLLLAASATRAETRQPGSLLVATEGTTWFTQDEIIEALKLRLPDWTVWPTPAIDASMIPPGGENDFILHLERSGLETARLTLISRKTKEILVREPLYEDRGPENELRRAAVLVAMALGLAEEETEESPQPEEPKPAELPFRPMVGVAGGISVEVAGRTVVSQLMLEGGALYRDHLLLFMGLGLASAFEGKNPIGQIAEVADLRVRLGTGYRFSLHPRWIADLAAALQYVHPRTKNLSSSRPVIEQAVVSRLSVRPFARLGLRLYRGLFLTLEAGATVSFARRVYEIDGRTAVDLGHAIIDFSGGAHFVF